jgi:hypothetical protein
MTRPGQEAAKCILVGCVTYMVHAGVHGNLGVFGVWVWLSPSGLVFICLMAASALAGVLARTVVPE